MGLTLNQLVDRAHKNSKDKGFWDIASDESLVNLTEILIMKMALVHTEVSEGVEAIRDGNLTAEERIDAFGEEMADVIIRVMDVCGKLDIDLEVELLKKMNKNEKRPRMHGKTA